MRSLKFAAVIAAAAGLSACSTFDFLDGSPSSKQVFAAAHDQIQESCNAKRDAGTGSFVAAAVCANDITMKAFHDLDYGYPDLVAKLNSQRLLLAERADKKEITATFYRAELLQDWSNAIREESLRIAPFGRKSGHTPLLGEADLFS
jgi:hypothetical protein